MPNANSHTHCQAALINAKTKAWQRVCLPLAWRRVHLSLGVVLCAGICVFGNFVVLKQLGYLPPLAIVGIQMPQNR